MIVSVVVVSRLKIKSRSVIDIRTCVVEGAAVLLLVVAALDHVLLPAAVGMLLVVPEHDGIAHRSVALAQVHVVDIHRSSFCWVLAVVDCYFFVYCVLATALVGHLPRAMWPATGTKSEFIYGRCGGRIAEQFLFCKCERQH